MIIILVGSFFVRWPQMPVDPTAILGMMFYVCDPPFIDRFDGLSMLEKKERDSKVRMMGSKYSFGEIRGVSGKKRMSLYGG